MRVFDTLCQISVETTHNLTWGQFNKETSVIFIFLFFLQLPTEHVKFPLIKIEFHKISLQIQGGGL